MYKHISSHFTSMVAYMDYPHGDQRMGYIIHARLYLNQNENFSPTYSKFESKSQEKLNMFLECT